MKKLTFVSHYFQFKTNIRLTDGKYQVLNNNFCTPIHLYYLDALLVSHGLEPQIFSVGQIKKLTKVLSGADYWDNII